MRYSIDQAKATIGPLFSIILSPLFYASSIEFA